MGDNWKRGAATTPTTPAITDEMIHVKSANRSGEKPNRRAPFSDSEAARMASPVRVNREASHNTMPRVRAIPVSHSASTASRISSEILITPLGRTLSRLIGEPLKRTPIMPCRISKMPTLATTLAKTGAARRMRKTNK